MLESVLKECLSQNIGRNLLTGTPFETGSQLQNT